MTPSLLIDNIGLLISNDPEIGERSDAAIVFEDGRVTAVLPAGSTAAAADSRIDAEGRCLIPGFVDSHTHLVFAGDRSDEFAARMAGTPYAAGGIRVTTDATRATSTADLVTQARVRRDAAAACGITHMEIKSGYGLDVETEARLCAAAAQLTDDVTFLGAHVVPSEFRDDPNAYLDLICGPMLEACAPHARWIDVFCETGAFDYEQSRRVLEAGHVAGLGLRVHGNQLGHGPGVQLAVELEAASVDHCTYLSDADVDALASSQTVATLLPATDFSTRQPYPDARRLLDAGATVAIATNCNPGSSFTSAMAFCLALAVRDMRMTVSEALTAATVGGARALRRTDIGHLGIGARADAVLLDAPSPTHLVYRPGMPLIAKTVRQGALVFSTE